MKYYNIVLKKILSQIDSQEYQEVNKDTEQGKVDRNHCLEVVEITKKLWEEQENTQTPEAILIAALTHDSDRLYPRRQVDTKNLPKEHYGYRKGIHSGNTALIFLELNINDLPITLIRDVCHLILRHERGGDKDKNNNTITKIDEYTNSYNLNKAANILYYADKISFFTSNIYEYQKRGEEKLKQKILFSTKDLPNNIKQKIKDLDYKDLNVKKIIEEII